jgi:nicotinamide-nucleotide amidase
MREMVSGTVIPELRELAAQRGESAVVLSRLIRTWGISESGLAERLAPRLAALDESGAATIAFLAGGPKGIVVRITAKAPDLATARSVLDREQEEVRDLVGRWIFGVDEQSMESVVLAVLRYRGLRLAVAESLTGGYLAGRLCAVPGASDVFRGGIVSYAGEVKHDLLSVPVGPVVSEAAALAMARGVATLMGAETAVATTGVAGPSEQEGQPVGTVCLAALAPGAERTTTVRLPGHRENVRQLASISALDLLRRLLLE